MQVRRVEREEKRTGEEFHAADGEFPVCALNFCNVVGAKSVTSIAFEHAVDAEVPVFGVDGFVHKSNSAGGHACVMHSNEAEFVELGGAVTEKLLLLF